MQITIPRRFQGIEGIAQGGHLAGLVAQTLDAEIAVRFRRPCPLDTPLTLDAGGAGHVLRDGEATILEVAGDDRRPNPPPPVSLEQAEMGRQWAERQPFAQNIRTCFSCGDSSHSFGVHAGLVDGAAIAATPFTYPTWTVSGGRVEPRFVWAPIDCAAGWRVALGEDGRPAVTGQLRVSIVSPPLAGEPLIAVAAAEQWEGRTRAARSAIYRPDGELVASADSIWVAVG
ncbi:MAG: PaaI family thioesterase [Acidimicrobiia bacterium]